MRQQARQSCDFEQFTDMVHKLLKAAWGPDWGVFCEAFPNGTNPESIKLPVITYSLDLLQPGIVGKETREVKPRIREEIRVDNSGEHMALTIFSQFFDGIVSFEIWEENNEKASQLAKEFRQFISIYTGYFMEGGLAQLRFREMNSNYSERWRDNIVGKKILYNLRLEEHTVIPSNTIQEVIGRVSVSDPLPQHIPDNDEGIDFVSK